MLYAKLSVKRVERFLWKYTNLCILHAWGCCPHTECMCNHSRDLYNILNIYRDELAKKVPKNSYLNKTTITGKFV